eukprot:6476975-Ditylum_brightwellii.AAC.1
MANVLSLRNLMTQAKSFVESSMTIDMSIKLSDSRSQWIEDDWDDSTSQLPNGTDTIYSKMTEKEMIE